jgi:anaphase-promoting complex subunit 2
MLTVDVQSHLSSSSSSFASPEQFLVDLLSVLPLLLENKVIEESQEEVKRGLNFFLFHHHEVLVKKSIDFFIQSYFNPSSSKRNQQFLILFHSLKWPSLYEKVFLTSLMEIVERKIEEICRKELDEEDDEVDIGNSSKSLLSLLKSWLQNVLYPILVEIFASNDHQGKGKLKGKEGSSSIIECDYHSIYEIAIEIFVSFRSTKLFDMITDYPDSLSQLIELKECITFRHSFLTIIGKKLRSILSKRLLHLGASTTQILDFYVSMIKSLRFIDSSDVLLNYVSIPVRTYLKQRKDTIRCIISSLTESKDSDLYDELKQGSSLIYGMFSEEYDEESGPGENWQPAKRNKELKNSSPGSSSSRGLDILATLVSIYGSTELFIVEYRNMLSEKLLSNLNYGTDQEVANLELLKIR